MELSAAEIASAGSSRSERDRFLKARTMLQRGLLERLFKKHGDLLSQDEKNNLAYEWMKAHAVTFATLFEDPEIRETLIHSFEQGMQEADWIELENKFNQPDVRHAA